MTTSNRHEYQALDWVKDELKETLKQAQLAIAAFEEDRSDTTRLQFCLTYLHQVRGTLEMVEVFGAALLARELERLAEFLNQHPERAVDDRLTVLLQGILQLPAYLDRIQSGGQDHPAIIAPLIDQIRACRDAPAVDESLLFAPRLAAEYPYLFKPVPIERLGPAICKRLQRLRQLYQFALLGILRGDQLDENLLYLSKASDRLASQLADSGAGEFWHMTSVVLNASRSGLLPEGTDLRPLLMRIERQLGQQIQATNRGQSPVIDLPLLQHLLYYIARARPETDALQKLHARFNLHSLDADQAMIAQGREQLTGPDHETLHRVTSALIDDLANVKESLDLFTRTDNQAASELGTLIPPLKQISDTLPMLRLEQVKRVLDEQISTLGTMAGQDAVDSKDILDVAGGLLYVESSLSSVADTTPHAQGEGSETHTMSTARNALVREIRNGIESCKEAVVAFIGSQWDRAKLSEVPHWLQQIEANLNIIPLGEPTPIITAIRHYVQRELLGDESRDPEWYDMDHLADALMGVDYYLERLPRDGQAQTDPAILARARDSLAALGYSVVSSAMIEPDEEVIGELLPADQAVTATVGAYYETADADSDAVSAFGDAIYDIDEEMLAEDDDFVFEPTSKFRFDDVSLDDEAALEDTPEVDSELNDLEFVDLDLGTEAPDDLDPVFAPDDSVLEPASATAPQLTDANTETAGQEEAAGVATPAAAEGAEEDDLIDDDIRDVFLEEAGEVQAELDQWLPHFANDWDDQNALTEIRRAFHTLKGSGRMVRAMVVGELAWAVENMLNRVLDGTVAVTAPLVTLVEDTVALLPTLVDDFAHARTTDTALTEPLRLRADALARGEVPTDSDEPPGSIAADDDSARLQEIFQQEINSHLNAVQDFVDHHKGETAPKLEDGVQRALHTIKGSAHMAGISAIADMVAPLEAVAKDIQSFNLDTPASFCTLLAEFVKMAKLHLAEQESGQAPAAVPGRFFAEVRALKEQLQAASTGGSADNSLMSIFLNEAMNTVLGAEDTLREWQSTGIENRSLKHLQQDLITLADAARAIELLPLSALANQLILLYEHLQVEPPADAEHPAFDVLYRAHDAIIDMMDRLAAGQSVQTQPDLEAELADLAGVPVAGPHELQLGEAPEMEPVTETAGPEPMADIVPIEAALEPASDDANADGSSTVFALGEHDPELLGIFLEEANELLQSVGEELEQWRNAPADLTPVAALQRDLHTLKGGARMAEATPVGDLAHELEFIYEAVSQNQLAPSEALLQKIQPAQDFLAQMVQDLTEYQHCQVADDLIQELHTLRTGKAPRKRSGRNGNAQTLPVEETALDAVAKGKITFTRDELNGLDHDILEVFVDEAVELIGDLDAAIHQWRHKPSDDLAADDMKRVLHTLKGGARLARLPSLGTLSHDLETYVVRAQQTHAALDDTFFKQVLTQYDYLSNAIEQLAQLMNGERDSRTAQPLANTDGGPDTSRMKPEFNAREGVQQVRRNAPQETVKVNANLLENLVNLAGESSIARARLEEQVNDLGYTLSDLDTTIQRLRDRVRQLDQETEAQVLFRQERAEESNYEDFDPLEMDRYSQIQQLSRSLMETSSDLLDLRTTLTNKSSDAETVLLQQSRIHTDLQEGLMQTRMVPFARLVPRLRRIVRQISSELGKSAEFEIHNAEGEMDRSVLERMISPLEHMLRNAVDHGLESPAERRQQGKPEAGHITLSLRREGGDVVLKLQDDGRGIDVASVRRKAVANGMLAPETDLPDDEVLQFILTSGFSTAQTVTQISGRGVGMDVVHNEVKALGGSMEITTEAGQGTTFTVRLPFTVSVNRALMVGAGEDIYAIPLNTIDGVARVQPVELAAYLNPEGNERFPYGGLEYRVQSLSQLIGSDTELHVEELDTPQPVILVKTPERQEPLALHVDRLMGSKEVVVKTLGPQFAVVPSVSGATILGDGSVVIILDLPALLRRNINLLHEDHESAAISRDGDVKTIAQPTSREHTKIMVIDDSVTVRKVTSRLLERHGYRVLTAKDGMDAMLLLQDHDPDILLLDIEMPRMDGFEVASRVRHTERLMHIPIIMITSRTGQKHKDRAAEIGVNEYMGKPFQEGPLLAAIERLVSA